MTGTEQRAAPAAAGATEAAPQIRALAVGSKPAFGAWAADVLGPGVERARGAEEALRALQHGTFDVAVIHLEELDLAPELAFDLLKRTAPDACFVGVTAAATPRSFEEDLPLHLAGMQLSIPLDAPRDQVSLLMQRLAGRPAEIRAERARQSALRSCLAQFRSWSANRVERLDEWVHELRTPLGIIRGFAENLLDQVYGPLTGQQRRAVERVASAARLLGGVVQQVRDDLPAPPSAEIELQPQRPGGRAQVALAEICEEVQELFASAAGARGVAIDLELAESPNVWGERLRLTQALVNLVKNALRFTPEGGRITIRLQPIEAPDGQSPSCLISVSDTGRGIAPDLLEKIFDAGFTTDHQDGHQGMGLAIVRQVLREHGGDLKVDSQPGHGTTFKMTLPVDPRRRRKASRIRLLDDKALAVEVLSELARRRVPLQRVHEEIQVAELCDELTSNGQEITVFAADERLCKRISETFAEQDRS